MFSDMKVSCAQNLLHIARAFMVQAGQDGDCLVGPWTTLLNALMPTWRERKKLRESAIQIRVCLPQLSVGEWATHLNPRRPTQRTGPGGWTTLLKALMPTQKKKTARKDAPHMVVPGPLIILVCRSLDHTLEGYDDAHTRTFKKVRESAIYIRCSLDQFCRSHLNCAKARSKAYEP